MSTGTYPIVLTIAGSDSGGGAGVQADLKTISALGCFGTTAITAITAQNTLGVTGIHPVPAEFVTAQIKAVMDDLKPATLKIGMVYSSALAAAIAGTLSCYPGVPIIFDPVMVTSSGDSLIEDRTATAFKHQLFPLSELVTPNLDEAAVLTGMTVTTIEDMKKAASRLLQYGCKSVLIKGGHLAGSELCDVYLHRNGDERVFSSNRINTKNTHGTGCTLSSAIASYIALGDDLVAAISKSKAYTHRAIEQGKQVRTGAGHGPLNHFFDPQKLAVVSR
jgi:hydroxymethylpyrimidine/phosphomethylpyrimidine kinase